MRCNIGNRYRLQLIFLDVFESLMYKYEAPLNDIDISMPVNWARANTMLYSTFLGNIPHNLKKYV